MRTAENKGMKEKCLILVSIVCGILSSAFGERWISLTGLCGLIPFLWLETKSRRTAFLVTFVFYLTFSRGIVAGAYVFFRDGSLIRAFVLWVSSAFALALP
jgi:hypothetical protein